jgi:hypothetical protein
MGCSFDGGSFGGQSPSPRLRRPRGLMAGPDTPKAIKQKGTKESEGVEALLCQNTLLS